jgi:plasmid maintenance system antidote protein VapI
MQMESEQVAVTRLARRLSRHRQAVEAVVGEAPRLLTTADVRRLARERDPSLSSLILLSAADELRREGKIHLAD